MQKRYLAAVRDFIKRCSFPDKVQTVYLGGGTPNFLSALALAELFEFIRSNVPLSSDCEISCELNPECMTESKLSVLNEHATRLSLGVQSFDAEVRKKLMRRCSDEHLSKALKLLQRRTAKHFNIDLIYGIADVPWSVFQKDMLAALAENADHLSCYALTPEENSSLGLSSPTADDWIAADWWMDIESFLSSHGIKRYEISNYAAAGCECKHNMNVWSGDTLLGIGSSASGFDGKQRYTFKSDIEDFIREQLYLPDYTSGTLRMLEIFAIKLRTSAGWQFKEWESRYPGTWEKLKYLSQRAGTIKGTWWHINDEQINLTGSGLLFWDDVAMDVLDWVDEFDL